MLLLFKCNTDSKLINYICERKSTGDFSKECHIKDTSKGFLMILPLIWPTLPQVCAVWMWNGS